MDGEPGICSAFIRWDVRASRANEAAAQISPWWKHSRSFGVFLVSFLPKKEESFEEKHMSNISLGNITNQAR